MDIVQIYQGLGGIIGAAATLVRNGRPFSEMGEELDAIARATDADLNRIAYDAVPLEQAVLILVGDKKKILPQLEGLDLPTPIELTASGELATQGG